jgi:hypothetical protein
VTVVVMAVAEPMSSVAARAPPQASDAVAKRATQRRCAGEVNLRDLTFDDGASNSRCAHYVMHHRASNPAHIESCARVLTRVIELARC